MPACPAGHESSATDFCDVCGMRIGGQPPGSAPPETGGAAGGPAEPCPQCGADRTGQFCEVCGFDFTSGTPGTPPAQAPGTGPGWLAVVTADRAYFDDVIAAGGPDAGSIEFPPYCPERRFRLAGPQMRVGRRSEPDGTWSVLDPGSSNGTQVNGADIAAGVPVPLHDGDRVCVGAWTMLTIQAG